MHWSELIGGDVVISPIDAVEPAFKNAFDWDSEIALRTRLATLDRLVAERAVVGASHLPAPGLGPMPFAVGGRITTRYAPPEDRP